MNTEALIEAILFYKASPMKVSEIARIFGKSADVVESALVALKERLDGRGIRLVRAGETVALATVPEVTELIETLRTEELSGEMGKATLETLTTILYRAPVSKSEIDYIRGVNSSSSLRTLLMRGLVERKRNEQGARGFVYAPTIDALAHLGVAHTDELPDYKEVREEVERFRKEFPSEEVNLPEANVPEVQVSGEPVASEEAEKRPTEDAK